MTFYQLALVLHVIFGTIALSSFWATAVLAKGTRLHRRIGAAYMLAMVGVMLTALPLAATAFLDGRTASGVFLSYLIVITGTPVWLAWRAIRDRRSIAAFIAFPFRPLAWLNVAVGAVVLAVGLHLDAPLLWGLSSIALYVGIRMTRFAAQPPSTANWWLKYHYTSIVGSGIAAHIAFLNVGLRRLWPAVYSAGGIYLAWFGPVLAAIVAVVWLDRRYGKGRDGARIASSTMLV